MSSDRVVVLRPDDPASFLADACAAAAVARELAGFLWAEMTAEDA